MVAVVTGASRGIGAATVKALLDDGFCVVGSSRKESDTVGELKSAFPDRFDFVPADISNPESIEALVCFVREKYGSLDLLVNDAGVAPRSRKDILEISPEDFDSVLDINLRGTFFVTQKFAPLLIKNGRARIVNISSVSAYTASVNRAEYCVSKAGISMLTKLFAARLAEHSVSVLEIRPGIVETDMTACVKEKYDKLIADGVTPINRMGQPSDIAGCVRAVARGDFDFCTGTVIDCDGGFNVRRL
ncbi:MAG: 3-ketoacyl-ACP reductase [Clostridiales bacterium]|nr:3-ketoacyl-ACP reductase [Clostridiales bacterium]